MLPFVFQVYQPLFFNKIKNKRGLFPVLANPSAQVASLQQIHIITIKGKIINKKEGLLWKYRIKRNPVGIVQIRNK